MKVFQDRVAVVTGAASGMGLAMAARFAAEGMKVVLADIEAEQLTAAAQQLAMAGAQVLAVPTDVSQLSEIERLADAAYDRFGIVNVLCNNAGVSMEGRSWALSVADWEWVLGVDLWSVVHGIRTFIPRMLAGGEEGHVVNTSSTAALFPCPYSAPYGLAKHGVLALTEALYLELHDQEAKVSASVLIPGPINTNINRSAEHRPGGAVPEPEPTTDLERMIQDVKRLLTGGMDPAEVADKVFNAIRDDRFYIFPHPELQHGQTTDRVDRMLRDLPPSLPAGLPTKSGTT